MHDGLDEFEDHSRALQPLMLMPSAVVGQRPNVTRRGAARAWVPAYDVVFYCCERFAQHQAGDPYRSKVLDLQSAADRVVRSTCATVGQRVIDIPPNMSTAERVRWTAARVTRPGSLRTHRPPHEHTACEGLDAWKDD
jgi:hypothetical protein